MSNIYKIRALQEYRDVEESQRQFMKWADAKYPADAPGRVQVEAEEPEGWVIASLLSVGIVLLILVVIGLVSFGRWMGGAW